MNHNDEDPVAAAEYGALEAFNVPFWRAQGTYHASLAVTAAATATALEQTIGIEQDRERLGLSNRREKEEEEDVEKGSPTLMRTSLGSSQAAITTTSRSARVVRFA